jgi:polyhydroxyalkanoate synthase subunit PhaC
MTDTPCHGFGAPQDDPAQMQAEMQKWVQHWMRLGGRAQQLIGEFALKQAKQPAPTMASIDPVGIASSWMSVMSQIWSDPRKIAEQQLAFWQDYAKLFQPDAANAPIKDKRFSAMEWQEHQLFDFLRQSYLLTAKYVTQTVHELDGLPPHEKAKLEFYTKQFVDAMSPSNFALTNPQVLKATLEEKGENLLRGLENLLDDLDRGRISMTDEKAFKVGENVAITPGQVVFENRMFQLIQYAPTTEKVYATPLVIFPPWINKFYILDLTAEKSLIRWCVEQGLTVFVVSWINPDSSYRDTGFDDYVLEGFIKATEVAREVTNSKTCNVIGYCVAGTMTAAALAYLHAKKQHQGIASVTFFTAQVDFSEAGDLSVFVDDDGLKQIDQLTQETGYLDASYMATTFNMLRSNDLIWSFVVSNYLLGKDPFPFDLLYWNSDSTRLPRACHLFYLENMYQKNRLVEPGGISINGVPIDLSSVKTRCYIQAGREDHIAPPGSVYKMLKHFKGPMRFVLAGSGHIAGVVNPPSMKKYQYWTNDAPPEDFADFLAGATEHPGSWWPDWLAWIKPLSGNKVAAREPGKGKYKAIEPAPGRYVRMK